MDAVIVFALIILFSAIAWHYAVKRYGMAVLGSTLTIVLLFQIAVIISTGYFDPFFTIALTALAVLTALITSIIGIPFLLSRKNRNHQQPD
jgi:multidrug efflux pump subunit AcrB